MSATDVCVDALRAGATPPEIATQQGLPLSSVLDYLDRAVGEGRIARSEIYFSMPGGLRSKVDAACAATGYRPPSGVGWVSATPVATLLDGLPADDIQVCLRYGPANLYYGDLYEVVRRYEIDLHRLVRSVLEAKFGAENRAWWYEGVPLKVRQGCVARTEELARFELDPWNCTYLLDLQVIVGQQWAAFSQYFRASSKNSVLSEIKSVNDVRNRVMHPVRDAPPTQDDFDTLRAAYESLQAVRGRFYGASQAIESQAR